MRKTFFLLVAIWACIPGSLFAQTKLPKTMLEYDDTAKTPTSAPALDLGTVESARPYRVWGGAEYLMWWVKNASLPVPIVTSGDPTVGFGPPLANTAGGIGQPGTQVLLGNGSQNLGTFSGMRITLGAWIDGDSTIGVEASGFLLERRAANFAAASDSLGNPPLYFPRFNPTTGVEGGVPIADPLRGFTGNVGVSSSLQLWGVEGNGLFLLSRGPNYEVILLGGFRYVDLQENLNIQNTTTDLIFGNVTPLNDFFSTRNQFYGGQLGARFAWNRDKLSATVTGKVALGVNHEVVNVQGSITQLGPNAVVPPGLGTFPGGFFAQPSNIGRQSHDQFGVLPSVEFKFGYQVTQRLKAFVGYDFLYWNQVVRPGDQMSHSVNLTQNAVLDPNGTGQLVGSANPAPQFNRTDFWAHGVTFGVEFRY